MHDWVRAHSNEWTIIFRYDPEMMPQIQDAAYGRAGLETRLALHEKKRAGPWDLSLDQLEVTSSCYRLSAAADP